jgi:hypothetical protein
MSDNLKIMSIVVTCTSATVGGLILGNMLGLLYPIPQIPVPVMMGMAIGLIIELALLDIAYLID